MLAASKQSLFFSSFSALFSSPKVIHSQYFLVVGFKNDFKFLFDFDFFLLLVGGGGVCASPKH